MNFGESENGEVIVYVYSWNGEKDIPSHELLRQAVGRYLGNETEAITVCRDGEFGKPYIAELPEVHFSISHSGGFWACAVSNAEVGLDLQEVKTAREEKIARRFFHPTEIEWLSEHGFDEFSRIWASKESYVKYTGVGLREGLDYFSVVDGGLAVCQQEVSFRDNFYMVVTTEKSASVMLLDFTMKAREFRPSGAE